MTLYHDYPLGARLGNHVTNASFRYAVYQLDKLKFRVAVCWFTFASFINCFTNLSIMTSVDESHDDDALFGGTYLTLRAEGNLCYLKSKYYDAIEFFTRVSYRVASFFFGVRAWLGTILGQFSIIYVRG